MEKARLWTKNYLTIAVVNFMTGINFYLIMIIVSEYAMSEFDAPSSQAGFAVSIFIIGALAARLFVGNMLVRVGYKKMLCFGITASIITTLAYMGVNTISLLFFVRLLHGAAFGVVTTSTATIVADIIPKERSGEGIAYFSLSQTLAIAIGPFLGMLLSRHGSYNVIFIICALTSMISLAIATFLSLRKIEFAQEQLTSARGLKLSDFIEYGTVPISIICLLIFLGYSSIVSFINIYAKAINLVEAASFFFIVYAAAVLITRPVVGKLFDSKGEDSVMYPAILIFSGGMFLLSNSYQDYSLLAAAAFIGIGFGAIQSSAQAIVVKFTPMHRLGQANSTYYIFTDIGMSAGPLLFGLLLPVLNYRGMYIAVSIIALICIFFYYLLHSTPVKRRAGHGLTKL